MSLETSFSIDYFTTFWVVVLTEAALVTGRRPEIKPFAISLESNEVLQLILCIAWLQFDCYTSCTLLKAQVCVGDPELMSLFNGRRNELSVFVVLRLTVSKFDLVISLTLSAWTRHAPEFLRGTLLPVVTSFPVELQTKAYFIIGPEFGK
jgi:hypothetical protein